MRRIAIAIAQPQLTIAWRRHLSRDSETPILRLVI